MDLEQYRKEVQRTAKHPTLSGNDLIINFAACLIEEVGEVTSVVKKHLWHGHELKRIELVKELGDLLWYVVALANIKDVKIITSFVGANETKQANLLILQYFANRLKEKIVFVNIDGTYHFGANYKETFSDLVQQIDNFSFLFDITMSEIMQTNVDKLRTRYPDKFTFKDSINR